MKGALYIVGGTVIVLLAEPLPILSMAVLITMSTIFAISFIEGSKK